MSVEAATYIQDLQPVNPPSSDPRSQGDDHLRLLKTVLQNTFPTLGKAIYFGTVTAKTANFTVVATDMNTLFTIGTGTGSVTATLPTLVAGDAGWNCRFIKTTSDVNPVFVAPASGTLTSGVISGLSQARRCIPGIEFRALWTGTAWIITRSIALPIGAMVSYNSATLPPGYEWPNGQTLSSAANYPEYNSVNGGLGTLDLRGRVAVTLDNLGGSSAGRLSGGIITGTAVGNTGGSDTRTLLTANLPPYTPAGTNAASGVSGTIAGSTTPGSATNQFAYGSGSSSVLSYSGTAAAQAFTGTAQGGTSTAFGILQPSIMCSKILVVE